MLFAFVPLVAQNALSAGLSATHTANAGNSEGQTAGGQNAESVKTSEKDLPINTEVITESLPTGGTSTLWLFVRMVLVLALVIACIYVLVFFLKKGFTQKVPENLFLKKAVSLSLAPGKTVHVITMPGKAWLIGACESSVNLIGEITDKDLVDQLILESEKAPAEKPKDFAGILTAFTAATKQTESVLKKQRQRFEREGGNE